MVPISRVRALTAANMVLAEENMAPKVKSTAIKVPATLQENARTALGLEIERFGDGRQTGMRLSSSIVCLSLVVFRRAGRAELNARDRAVATGILLDVLEIGPDLAFGRAAAGRENADDVDRSPWRRTSSLPPTWAPLNARDIRRLTMHSPLPSTKSLPATILKSGRSLREAG